MHSPDYILCGKYEFGCKWKMSKIDFRGDKIRGGFTQFPWNGCITYVDVNRKIYLADVTPHRQKLAGTGKAQGRLTSRSYTTPARQQITVT